MTHTIDKPKSNKAKSHYRHDGSQDHGDADQRKGHEDYGSWEKSWNRRGKRKAGRFLLNEATRNGLDDYEDRKLQNMSPQELQKEADRILSETESEENVDYFLLSDRDPYAHGYHDMSDGRFFEPDYSYSDRLKSLENTLKSLKQQLADMPGLAKDDRFNQQRYYVESEIQETIAAINSLLGRSDFPEAENGIPSRRTVRKHNEQQATLDHEYDEEDLGYDDAAVGARITRR